MPFFIKKKSEKPQVHSSAHNIAKYWALFYMILKVAHWDKNGKTSYDILPCAFKFELTQDF